MSDSRPIGVVVGLVGAVVLAVAALGDTLGIGEGHTFGWLQILGVVLGAVILLIGLAIVVGWIPTRRKTVVTSGPEGTTTTTVVEETPPSVPPPPSQTA